MNNLDKFYTFNDDGYNDEGYNLQGFDRDGYNRAGYNRYGYNREGYSKDEIDRKNQLEKAKNMGAGYDKDGYNKFGRDKLGYDRRGFKRTGIHKNGTRFDSNGFDIDGYDCNGYNYYGVNREGYDKDMNKVVFPHKKIDENSINNKENINQSEFTEYSLRTTKESLIIYLYLNERIPANEKDDTPEIREFLEKYKEELDIGRFFISSLFQMYPGKNLIFFLNEFLSDHNKYVEISRVLNKIASLEEGYLYIKNFIAKHDTKEL